MEHHSVHQLVYHQPEEAAAEFHSALQPVSADRAVVGEVIGLEELLSPPSVDTMLVGLEEVPQFDFTLDGKKRFTQAATAQSSMKMKASNKMMTTLAVTP
jgi:hypothetical protein